MGDPPQLGALGRTLREPRLPRAHPRLEVEVEALNEDPSPIEALAGEEDHLQPAAVNESNFKHYRNSSAVTDYKEFPGRAHYTVGQDGWEEVADYALEWATANATRRAS
jgi:hypothetical protein